MRRLPHGLRGLAERHLSVFDMSTWLKNIERDRAIGFLPATPTAYERAWRLILEALESQRRAPRRWRARIRTMYLCAP